MTTYILILHSITALSCLIFGLIWTSKDNLNKLLKGIFLIMWLLYSIESLRGFGLL